MSQLVSLINDVRNNPEAVGNSIYRNLKSSFSGADLKAFGKNI